MDSASKYLDLGEPSRSSHLWKYTPWKRVHPSGNIGEIPKLSKPKLSLSLLDGDDAPDGITLIEGGKNEVDLPDTDEITHSFLEAISEYSKMEFFIRKEELPQTLGRSRLCRRIRTGRPLS